MGTHLPREQKPVLWLGCNLLPTLGSLCWRKAFHVHLTVASRAVVRSGAPTWGCIIIA